MSLFQTLAGGLFDGTPQVAPVAIAETGLPSIVRTNAVAAGSYDITFANPNKAPNDRVVVKITAQSLPAHNLTPGYLWLTLNGVQILRVNLRDDTGALTDGVFGVEVMRVTAQNT